MWFRDYYRQGDVKSTAPNQDRWKRPDVNAKDDSGETALSYASRRRYEDIVRLLKEEGAR